VPVIDDDGFVVAESGAVLLYIAEKAGSMVVNGSPAVSSRSPIFCLPLCCGRQTKPIFSIPIRS